VAGLVVRFAWHAGIATRESRPSRLSRCPATPPAGPRSGPLVAGTSEAVVSRPDQVSVDRFDVAIASFWLDEFAGWLREAGHADCFAADLWPGFVTAATQKMIVGRAAAAPTPRLGQPPRAAVLVSAAAVARPGL
jgi:hypothetical protein